MRDRFGHSLMQMILYLGKMKSRHVSFMKRCWAVSHWNDVVAIAAIYELKMGALPDSKLGISDIMISQAEKK